MKFNKLHIKNFLTIGEATLNLEDKGLQLIQGINEDDSSASSNGSGKSSVVDAICWVLYGVTAREVKGDSVVNLAAKKNCSVSIGVSSEAQSYLITRHRKHSVKKNSLIIEALHYEGHPTTDISKGTDSETQIVLEKIIGCSYDVFKAAVYCGQEAMPDLPKMKDRELKVLIEEAAGLQRIEGAYQVARERHLVISAVFAKSTQRREDARTHLADLELDVHETSMQIDGWTAGRAEFVKTKEKTHQDAVQAEEKLALSLKPYEATAKHAKQRIIHIEEALSSHKQLERDAIAAEKLEREAEKALDVDGLKRIIANIKTIEAQIANPEAEIKKPCSECGTVLETTSAEEYVKHKQAHLEAAKAQLDEAKAKAQIRLKHYKSCKQSTAELRSKVPDVTTLLLEAREFRAIIAGYEEEMKDFARAKQNTSMAKMSLDVAVGERNPHAESLVQLGKKLTDARTHLEMASEELKKHTLNSKVIEATTKVFGSSGVRAQILDTVTPFLNERTADYLSALSDGEIQATWTTLTKTAAGEYREKFGIEVYHAKGGDSFASLSGGEKRKVRLATALALQDLVASRATKPINLFVGDELDDALDPAGLERLMSVLERKARERGTVIIISHSDLKDWCDNVTVVRKTAQWTSSVEGSLCV